MKDINTRIEMTRSALALQLTLPCSLAAQLKFICSLGTGARGPPSSTAAPAWAEGLRGGQPAVQRAQGWVLHGLRGTAGHRWEAWDPGRGARSSCV